MKNIKYPTIILASSLFAASAMAESLQSVEAGGKWSEASTWVTAPTAQSTKDNPVNPLTLGAGTVYVDRDEYVNAFAFTGSSASLSIDSGKVLNLVCPKSSGTAPVIAAGKTLTIAGDGKIQLSAGNPFYTAGTLYLDAELQSSYTGEMQFSVTGSGKVYITKNFNTNQNPTSAWVGFIGAGNNNGGYYIYANANIDRWNAHSGGTNEVGSLAKPNVTLNVRRDVYFRGGSTFTVRGTMNTWLSNSINTKYGWFGGDAMFIGTVINKDNAEKHANNAKSHFIVEKGATLNVGTASYASTANGKGIALAGQLTVRGDVNVAHHLRAFNQAVINLEGGKITAKSIIICNYTGNSDTGTTSYVYQNMETNVKFNVKESTVIDDLLLFDSVTKNATNGSSNSQRLSGITGTETFSTILTIDFANLSQGSTLTIKTLEGLLDSTLVGGTVDRYIKLANYVDGALKIGTKLDVDEEGYVYGIYGSDGEMFYQLADGTITAIPEPATYAGILGALAIAFAFMRRRK